MNNHPNRMLAAHKQQVSEQKLFLDISPEQTQLVQALVAQKVLEIINGETTLHTLYTQTLSEFIRKGGDGDKLNETLQKTCADAIHQGIKGGKRVNAESLIRNGTFLCQYTLLEDAIGDLEYLLDASFMETIVQIENETKSYMRLRAEARQILSAAKTGKDIQISGETANFLASQAFDAPYNAQTYLLLSSLQERLGECYMKGRNSSDKLTSKKAQAPTGIIDLSEKEDFFAQARGLLKAAKEIRERISKLLPMILMMVREDKTFFVEAHEKWLAMRKN